MKEIIIRKAAMEELPTLREFEQGIIAFERPYDETLKDGQISYYDIKAMIEAEETEVLVAEVDKEIVGSAYVSIKQAKPYLKHSHYGYLGFMYVKPEYRGMGINKKIIEGLKNWSRTKNLNELRLDVYAENQSAVRAYEKAGFKKNLVNMRLEI